MNLREISKSGWQRPRLGGAAHLHSQIDWLVFGDAYFWLFSRSERSEGSPVAIEFATFNILVPLLPRVGDTRGRRFAAVEHVGLHYLFYYISLPIIPYIRPSALRRVIVLAIGIARRGVRVQGLKLQVLDLYLQAFQLRLVVEVGIQIERLSQFLGR